MSNTFGQKLKVTIFGESHGVAIGCVIDGLPAGISIDWDAVRQDMARRAPGSSALATPRKEKDALKSSPVISMTTRRGHRSRWRSAMATSTRRTMTS